MLKGKKILIGVTGGIAAYKIPFLVRELKKKGAEVRLVMSRAAAEFINPVTLSALSENEVITETFPDTSQSIVNTGTWHIHLGMWADIYLIAPATANTIAKITFGIADNPVTIMAQSVRCPLAISPAMDTFMWEYPATQENIFKLQDRGCLIINPDVGELASGLIGKGRLPEINKLVKEVDKVLNKSKNDLEDVNILVTAGPTYEAIDPVRFIGNKSSGKMGYAIAKAAMRRGANVVLVSGPTALQTPNGVKKIKIETAEQMFRVVNKNFDNSDVVIMSAAVADFTPTEISAQKIKKNKIPAGRFTIELKKTKDILASLALRNKDKKIIVGFALETDNEFLNAKQKIKEKNLDLLVLNNPLTHRNTLGGDTNLVTILKRNGSKIKLPVMSKYDVANKILDHVILKIK